ncbi:MAG: hypothetical protein WD773_05180 [Gemmatimonadales bacterium]
MTQAPRVGDIVEVRSRSEILATLDANGCLDGLPFMPEMLAFCGQRVTVRKSAHKTCDTIQNGPLRRMHAAVHLAGTRCSGAAHDGCEAGCELFWKTAWLKAVKNGTGDGGRATGGCTEARLVELTRRPTQNGDETLFRCQATEMVAATVPLSRWDVRSYVRDVRSGNVGAWALCKSLAWSLFTWMTTHLRGYRLQVWLFNTIQRRRGGTPLRVLSGERSVTPKAQLDLQPGELVQVKRVEEITATLDRLQKNRGLYFDLELTPFCGRTFTVERRIRRIIDERSGRMLMLPGDCILLSGVVCTGRYHGHCPRATNAYWREIWLRRVSS